MGLEGNGRDPQAVCDNSWLELLKLLFPFLIYRNSLFVML